jgi:hypothetical protein
MATSLDRPPTGRQIEAVRPSETRIVTAHADRADSLQHWWLQPSMHDRAVALLLAIGESGALTHGAAWAALLGLLTDHGKHAEQPTMRVAQPTSHSGPVH